MRPFETLYDDIIYSCKGYCGYEGIAVQSRVLRYKLIKRQKGVKMIDIVIGLQAVSMVLIATSFIVFTVWIIVS